MSRLGLTASRRGLVPATVLLFWVCAAFPARAQFTNLNATLPGISGGGSLPVAWGDYDNDGKLDLVIGSGNLGGVWRNNGNGTFTSNAIPGLGAVTDGAVAWGDFDNDGYLDFAILGGSAGGNLAQIWRNQGNGTFTNLNAGLVGASFGAIAWGDYDNDGKLDLVYCGHDGTNYNFFLYHNNGNGTFTRNTNSIFPSLRDGAVAWGDYDKDGWVDLLVAGQNNGTPICQVWHNQGNGTFTNLNAGLTGVWHAGVAWGDYDNDGYLDVMLSGGTATGSNGGPTNLVLEVWRNAGNGTFSKTATSFPGIASGSARWGDFDNDGKLDVLLVGATNDATGAAVAQVWRNTGGGVFTNLNLALTGVRSGCGLWGDYDADGRLDFLIAGWNNSSGALNQVWHSVTPASNTVPTAPTGLTATLTGNGVMLSWNAATDAQTPAAGLSYNVRVGTAPGGGQVLQPQANIATGLLRLPRLGNAQNRTFLALTNLAWGTTNYWSVQAVDTAFGGSTFATESSFLVALPPAISNVVAFTGSTSTNENLFAAVNPNYATTTVSFQYGLTTNYGGLLVATNLPPAGSPGVVRATLSGLAPNTSYHYRLMASNQMGSAVSGDQVFTTRGDAWAVVAYYRAGEMDGTNALPAVPGSQATLFFDSVGGHHVPVVTPATFGDGTISAQPVYATNLAAAAASDTASSLAIDFGNGNAYGLSGVFYPGTDNFCLEVWVKPGSISHLQYIVWNGGQQNGWGLVQRDNVFQAESLTTAWSNYLGEDFGSAPAIIGQWVHLALVSEGGVPRFYVNGIPNATAQHPLALGGGSFTIGKGPVFSYRFGGQVDEVRLSTFSPGQFSVTNLLLKSIPPAVTSPTIGAITVTNAVLGGTVIDQGGTPVTERGIVYAPAVANLNPTIGGASVVKVVAEGSTGAFTVACSGLSPGTTYAFCPYAINTFGPVYGPVAQFTTAFADFSPLVNYRLGEADPGAVAGGVATNTVDSVGTNDLVLTGGPLYSADTPANQDSSLSLNLGAGTAYGTRPVLVVPVDNFGFEAWVKPATSSGVRTLLYNGNTGSSGWGVIQNGNVFQVLFGGVVQFGSAPVVLNQWTHLAVVRDSGRATFYTNGVAAGTTTNAPAFPSGGFAVGVDPGNLLSSRWAGSLDHVRVFGFPAGQFNVNQLLLKLPVLAVEQPLGSSLTNGGSRGFGAIAVGNSSDLIFTVRNQGATNLTGLSLTLDGSDAAQFSVVTNPAAIVPAGGSTSFTVRFTPTAAGNYSAAWHLAANDPINSPLNVSLTGSGVALPTLSSVLALGGSASTNANFYATVNGNYGLTAVRVQYGLTTNYGNLFLAATLPSSGSNVAVRVVLGGLTPGTMYHYQVIASNLAGSVITGDQTFAVREDALSVLAYYPLGELDGTNFQPAQTGATAAITVDAASTNDLPLSGAPTYTVDTATNQNTFRSLNFGSGSAYGARPLLSTLLDNFGFEVWVKPATNSGAHSIIYNGNMGGNGWGLIQNGGVFQVLFGGVAQFGSAPVALNQWTHLALVRDSGVATFYVNGAVAATLTNAPAPPSGGFAIGADAGNLANNRWVGGLDEVRVFKFAAGQFTVNQLLLRRPTIVLEQPAGTPLANGGSLDLGAPALGGSSDLTVILRNAGNTNLTDFRFTIDGSDAALFSVVTNLVASVPAGASASFTLRFTRSSLGLKSAALHLVSNDPTASPFHVALTGAAFVPQMVVEYPPGQAITNGSLQDAGAVVVGSPATCSFTVLNLGTATLALTGAPPLVISGANAADFVLSAPPVSSLEANGSSLADAGFEAPVLAGGGFAYAASGAPWTIGGTAGIARNGSPWYVNPAPEGFQAGFVQNSGAGAMLTQDVSFPKAGDYVVRCSMVRRGAGYQATDVDVRMDGVTLGTVLNTSLPDDTWRAFSFRYRCTNAGTHTLAFVGTRGGGDYASAIDDVRITASTAFQITFTPLGAGVRTATLAIPSNDDARNPYVITLTGTGLTPQIVLEQPSGTALTNGAGRDFGTVNVGTNRGLTFTLRNTGTADLLLTGTPRLAVGGANPADFVVTGQPPSPWTNVPVLLTNDGFETPAATPGAYAYAPSGSGWTFSLRAGIANNGSPWYRNPAPEGLQAAFIQNSGTDTGSLSRSFNFPNPGVYVISFQLVRRGFGYSGNDVDIRMDGVTLGSVPNTSQPDDVWRSFSVTYNCAAAGNHELAFVGTRAGGDCASAIDQVQITALVPPTFQVTFAPLGGGLRTATLTIANNSLDQNPFNILLTGVGVLPRIDPGSLVRLNGGFQLKATAIPGNGYSLYAASNLTPGIQWLFVSSTNADSNGSVVFSDAILTNWPQKFYRLTSP